MTTVSSPNADIANQARTAANRASSTSTTAKSGDQPADPFAALFDAAMLLQTDPSLATAIPVTVGKDIAADATVAEDDSLVTETPVDPATLLASLPWPLPTDPAVAVPVATMPDTAAVTDDAAAGLAAAVAATTTVPTTLANVTLNAASVVATPTPETAALADLIPGNQLASGVRRAGQALGETTLGVQARSDSAVDSDAEPVTGKAAVADSIDPTALASSTALELAAAANATAAASARNENAGTADSATAASGVLAGGTSAVSAGGAVAARHEIPTVPGAPVPLHAQQLQARVDDSVRWMSTQNIQTAEIRVTPDDLGPITVHLRMNGDVANVSFTSEHAQTRQALEASMGGLRTALGDSGLQLGQAQVGSEQQNQQAFAAFANSGGEDRRARQAAVDRMQATVNALGERPPTPALSGTSLVDLYA